MGWKPDGRRSRRPTWPTASRRLDDGKTVTFHIQERGQVQPAARWGTGSRSTSQPTSSTRSSASIMPGVANGYTAAYLGDLVGFKQAAGRGQEGPDQSLRTSAASRRLTTRRSSSSSPSRQSAAVIQALSLPVSAPVPEEYAKKSTRRPVRRRQNVVFTGPYMVQNDCVNTSGKVVNPNCTGKLTGYTAGQGDRPGSKPELGPEYRLPARVRGQDRSRRASRTRSRRRKKILTGADQVSGDFSLEARDPEARRGSKYTGPADRHRLRAVTGTSR